MIPIQMGQLNLKGLGRKNIGKGKDMHSEIYTPMLLLTPSVAMTMSWWKFQASMSYTSCCMSSKDVTLYFHMLILHMICFEWNVSCISLWNAYARDLFWVKCKLWVFIKQKSLFVCVPQSDMFVTQVNGNHVAAVKEEMNQKNSNKELFTCCAEWVLGLKFNLLASLQENLAEHPHALVLSFCFRACRSLSLSKSLVANGSSSTLIWGNTTLCVQCSNNLSNSRKWDLSIKLVWCLWGCLWRHHWTVAPETGVVLNEGPGLMYSRAWCRPVDLDSLDVFCTPKYSTYEERKKS